MLLYIYITDDSNEIYFSRDSAGAALEFENVGAIVGDDSANAGQAQVLDLERVSYRQTSQLTYSAGQSGEPQTVTPEEKSESCTLPKPAVERTSVGAAGGAREAVATASTTPTDATNTAATARTPSIILIIMRMLLLPLCRAHLLKLLADVLFYLSPLWVKYALYYGHLDIIQCLLFYMTYYLYSICKIN